MLLWATVYTSLNAVITDGERLTFGINYGLMGVAEATLEVKSDKYKDVPVWLLNSSAKTYSFFDSVFKVRDTVQSTWEKENLRSLRFSKKLSEGNYRQYRIHYYDQQNKTSIYKRWDYKKQIFKDKQIAIPANTQDILSAFYLVRQKELYPGKVITVDVTTDGSAHKTQIIVRNRETIDSIFGKKQCLIIEPILKGESIFRQSDRVLIWVTDDEYKIPLKMTSKIIFGAFTATLKSAANVPYPLK
jgi:hypothetical protein